MSAEATTIPTAEQRVQRVIAEFLGVTEKDVTPEAHLVNDLGADSLDEVEIVMALEDEFGIEIPDSDAGQCRTVAKTCEVVRKYLELRA